MAKSAVLFMADRKRRDVWLVELYPRRRDTGAVEVLRFATEGWSTRPGDTPANALFLGRLVNAFNVALESVVPGTVGAIAGAKGGELVLGSLKGDLDALATDYRWSGARVDVSLVGYWAGGRLEYPDRVAVWSGEADQALPGLDSVRIAVRDGERFLDDPLTLAKFSGSTWELGFGASSVVTFGAPSKVNITGDVSIVASLSLESLAGNNYVLSWNNSATTYPFALLFNTSGYLLYRNSNVSLAGVAAAVPSGVRLTIAATVSGSTLRLYAWREDTGRLVYDSTVTLSSASKTAGDGNLRIGEHSGGKSAGMTLDRLLVFSRVLTRYEIEALRHRQLSAAEIAADSTLKLCLSLEEGTGTTATDATSSPANGTITSGTWRLSLEGGADLEGKEKPAAFGKREAVEPVLVYAPTRIYQVADTAVSSIVGVSTGGNAITFGAAYTTLASFLAGSASSGHYDTLIYSGGSFVRLGSNPDKPVTVSLLGDASGSGYVSTAADVARRIVTARGRSPLADPAGLDTSSFSDLNTANSSAVGFYARAGESVSLRDALAFVLGSVGAVAWRRRASGLFAVKRFEGVAGSPVAVVTERQIRRRNGFEPVSVELPVWSVTVRYRPCDRVLSVDERAAAIVGTSTEAFFAERWRSVTRIDPQTLAEEPRAREVVVETGLTTDAAAAAEAVRLLAWMKAPRRAWKVAADVSAATLDRFDVVTLRVLDRNARGEEIGRFGLGEGADFVCLACGGSQADGLESLVLWGAA